jgi:hypothetical protein
VARTLEAEWEQRLRDLETVEQQYAEARRERRVELSPLDRQRIRELARDLPTVWRAKTTNMSDKKAMLRLVVEAIALHPIDVPRRVTRVCVQWTSGAVDEVEIVRPGRGESHRHDPAVLQRIGELAAAATHDEEIARRLNLEGLRSGTRRPWTQDMVRTTRSRKGIERLAADRPRMPPLPHRHPDGRYSVPGAMARFGVGEGVIHRWIRQGLVTASRADFGTHRNVHWLDIDEATAARLTTPTRNR